MTNEDKNRLKQWVNVWISTVLIVVASSVFINVVPRLVDFCMGDQPHSTSPIAVDEAGRVTIEEPIHE